MVKNSSSKNHLNCPNTSSLESPSYSLNPVNIFVEILIPKLNLRHSLTFMSKQNPGKGYNRTQVLLYEQTPKQATFTHIWLSIWWPLHRVEPHHFPSLTEIYTFSEIHPQADERGPACGPNTTGVLQTKVWFVHWLFAIIVLLWIVLQYPKHIQDFIVLCAVHTQSEPVPAQSSESLKRKQTQDERKEVLFFPFQRWRTEACRDKVICPRSHRESIAGG